LARPPRAGGRRRAAGRGATAGGRGPARGPAGGRQHSLLPSRRHRPQPGRPRGTARGPDDGTPPDPPPARTPPADADHSQVDRGVRLEDCTTQRNLTDRGRDHSRALGEAIRSLGIPIGAVLASPMCRTMETATLAFGTALKSPAVREGGPLAPGTPGRVP